MFPDPFAHAAALALALAPSCSSGSLVRADESRGADEPRGRLAEYTVRIAEPSERAVEVEARFTGLADAPATIAVAMPESFAFVRLKEPMLEGPVRALSRDGRALALERTGPFAWKLARDGADEVTLAWRVPMRFHDVPEVADRDAYEFPYIADDHAMLATAAILMTPTLDGPVKPRVRFLAPDAWPVLCPWPKSKDGWYEPASMHELANDLVAAGAWRTRRVSAGGMEIDVAFAPGQSTLEALAGPAIEKIVAAEIELFGRAPRERYLFLFVAPRPIQGFSFAGSPKTGSMTLQVNGDVTKPIALELVSHLVAHEFHHTWAQAGCELPDDLRFVNEGFTDWYALQVPARLGLISWQSFGEEIGKRIASYSRASKAAGVSLAGAGGPKFFEGGPCYETVYAGGTLVAALLDLELRRAGRADGLDGFLRRFIADERWWPHRRSPTLDELLTQVEQETSRAVRERVERCVKAPAGFDARAELVASGAAIEAVETPRSLRANFDGTRITAIDPNCESHALGLRTGDDLRSVNGIELFDQAAIQRAWRSPAEGQVVVELERAGKPLELRAAAMPAPTSWKVDPAPWKR